MTYTITHSDEHGRFMEVIEDEALAAKLAELPAHLPLAWRVLEDHWNDDFTIRTVVRAEMFGDTP